MFRAEGEKSSVYLTFDDGPIPESTPLLLGMLREADAKATFFMVADNARRYPHLHKAVVDEGHAVGNHTFHHRPPYKDGLKKLMDDVSLADSYLGSRLFRPPHGLMTLRQQKALHDAGYRIVMFDLNTGDYRPDRTPEEIVRAVEKYVRPGCVINMHDSLKSIDKLRVALPEILRILRQRGYTFEVLDSGIRN